MRMASVVGCLFAVAAGRGPVSAELVYFARGGQAELPAKIEGDEVRLDTPDGPKVFPRGDFLAIIPGHRPSEEWTSRRAAALKEGGAESKFSAFWWALENGLTAEAVAFLGEMRPLGSTHAPTRRAIAALDAMTLPCPDPDLDRLRLRLRPLRFREARSAHVLLLHQVGEAEARERLDVLERVVQTFTLSFASQGVELATPRRRLVSVYFAEHRDYANFLRLVDAAVFVDTQGYYHPGLHTVFAFDTRSTDGQRAGQRAIVNRKKEGTAPSELARQSLLLDLEWRTTDLGIAAHETIHQLTAESGLAPRTDDFPQWLHEGLAAQFEVVRGGRWAGFGRVHDLRLPDWRTIRPLPRIVPLIRDAGFGHGYRRDLYAESWALVYFLRKTRPREFLTFLDLLRAPSPEPTARPDRSLEAFRAAFGNDLGVIESAWHRYLAELKTPLESARPIVDVHAVLDVQRGVKPLKVRRPARSLRKLIGSDRLKSADTSTGIISIEGSTDERQYRFDPEFEAVPPLRRHRRSCRHI